MLFRTLVAEGCWGRQGCCPQSAEFAFPVLGQDKGTRFGAEGQQWGYTPSPCSYSAASGSPQTSCHRVQSSSSSGKGEQPAVFLQRQNPFPPMTNALLVPKPGDSAIPHSFTWQSTSHESWTLAGEKQSQGRFCCAGAVSRASSPRGCN